jgi:hypothetical protein
MRRSTEHCRRPDGPTAQPPSVAPSASAAPLSTRPRVQPGPEGRAGRVSRTSARHSGGSRCACSNDGREATPQLPAGWPRRLRPILSPASIHPLAKGTAQRRGDSMPAKTGSWRFWPTRRSLPQLSTPAQLCSIDQSLAYPLGRSSTPCRGRKEAAMACSPLFALGVARRSQRNGVRRLNTTWYLHSYSKPQGRRIGQGSTLPRHNPACKSSAAGVSPESGWN